MRVLDVLATGWSRFLDRHSRRPSLSAEVGGMAWLAVILTVIGTVFAVLVVDTPNSSLRANRLVAVDVSTSPAKVGEVIGVFFVGRRGQDKTGFPFMMVARRGA
jgi:hypothetical protein